MGHFGIAGLQLALSSQDNSHIIEHEIDRAKAHFPWINMIVASELSLFGTKTSNACALPGEIEQQLCAAARRNNVWLIPGSLFEKQEERTYNTALVINPAGEVVARYRKMFPFQPYETGVANGDEFIIFDVPDVGRFGLSICYDMWFPETTRTLAWMGAEAIIHPTLTGTLDRDVELAIARANAATNQCYFVDINTAGEMGSGQSIILGPGGEVIHQAGRGREVIAFEVDFNHVRRCRERGWQGLGQVLKSFRDSEVRFRPYVEGLDSEPLRALGPLHMPVASGVVDAAN